MLGRASGSKNGANFEAPPRRPPLTADEMVATAAGVEITDGRARDDELPFPFGNGGDGQAGAGSIPPKIGGESAVGPAAGQGGTANPADAASAPGPVTVPAGPPELVAATTAPPATTQTVEQQQEAPATGPVAAA